MTRQRLEYHQIIRSHLRTAYLLPEEKIDTVLPRFLTSLQTLMHNLEQVAASETAGTLARAGHAIKGALLSLGLQELAAVAYFLEQDCQGDDGELDCAQIIATLREEIAKIT